jgi:hypothetical protein
VLDASISISKTFWVMSFTTTFIFDMNCDNFVRNTLQKIESGAAYRACGLCAGRLCSLQRFVVTTTATTKTARVGRILLHDTPSHTNMIQVLGVP